MYGGRSKADTDPGNQVTAALGAYQLGTGQIPILKTTNLSDSPCSVQTRTLSDTGADLSAPTYVTIQPQHTDEQILNVPPRTFRLPTGAIVVVPQDFRVVQTITSPQGARPLGVTSFNTLSVSGDTLTLTTHNVSLSRPDALMVHLSLKRLQYRIRSSKPRR